MFVKSEQLWDIIPDIENLQSSNHTLSAKIEAIIPDIENLQSSNHTLSAKIEANKEGKLTKTQYDWRKIEQVTMKANFIYFSYVES